MAHKAGGGLGEVRCCGFACEKTKQKAASRRVKTESMISESESNRWNSSRLIELLRDADSSSWPA
eukprot:4345077-Prymnesium_polylepis.1